MDEQMLISGAITVIVLAGFGWYVWSKKNASDEDSSGGSEPVAPVDPVVVVDDKGKGKDKNKGKEKAKSKKAKPVTKKKGK